MDSPSETPKRPREAILMAALDTIWREAEAAMAALQDDGQVTGPADKKEILRATHVIEAKTREIRDALMSSGEYSSLRTKDED